ncbi:hypothetical protein HHK36_025295 [Tetracentron sinense]|uniref:CBS domain-containing protein n=1 Tax=Tetracentron sinense TaxID=13715 RepID=A0A835D7K4_TETSI|nr:hypothetical protein HHK36_025295 [Tetracentron sinense]
MAAPPCTNQPARQELGPFPPLSVKFKLFFNDIDLHLRRGLAGVPIWDDCKGQFSGMLTVSDFILILTELHKNGPMLTSEELEMHSISAWKEEKSQLHRKSDGSILPSCCSPLIQVRVLFCIWNFCGLLLEKLDVITYVWIMLADPQESLKDVALRILQNKISTVPVIHSTQDGSCQQLLHLACLPGILKHICRHFRHSPGTMPLLQQAVGSLPLGTWVPEIGRASGCQLTTLQPGAPLSSALSLLIEAQISSIPIVDDNGSLLDVYSRSDITSLAKSNVYARIQLDQTNMHQALQLAFEANNTINANKRCQTCLRSDSLHVIMERLSDPAVRRLIVIEAGSKRVEGIISLRDVFNFILV